MFAVKADDDAGGGLDLCEAEQSALARRYVLTSQLYVDEPWSHAGPNSISPFAPCAETRLPHIFDAARLTPDSVLWDLGCGDGRVLHEAAARYGCTCVGLEIDAPCLDACRERAASLGPSVDEKCKWHLRDITSMPPGTLGTDYAVAPDSPAPSVLLIFITGHGLVAVSEWLRREWLDAPKPFAIITCVESLDTCIDYNLGVFGQDENPHGWEVYRDTVHSKYGVFVVPPRDVTVDEWRRSRPQPIPCDPAAALRMAPAAVVRGVLDEDDIAEVERLVAERAAPPRGVVTRSSRRSSRGAGHDKTVNEKKNKKNHDADTVDGGGDRGEVDSRHDSGGDGDRGSCAAAEGARAGGGTTDGADRPTFPRAAADQVEDEDEDEALAMELAGALLADDGDPDEMWSAVEDTYHALPTHRVVHLHADDALATRAPRVRAKLLRAAFQADRHPSAEGSGGGGGWGLIPGRPVFIRSAEYHSYTQGGGVTDDDHRDTGSVLTMSVLLEAPRVEDGEEGGGREGGVFYTMEAERVKGGNCGGGGGGDDDDVASSAAGTVDCVKHTKTVHATLRRGDAVVFPSEMRHGVTPVVGADGRRASVVLELWEHGVNKHNRLR